MQENHPGHIVFLLGPKSEHVGSRILRIALGTFIGGGIGGRCRFLSMAKDVFSYIFFVIIITLLDA